MTDGTPDIFQRKDTSGRDSARDKGPSRTPQPAHPGEHDRLSSRPQDPTLARRRSVTPARPAWWRSGTCTFPCSHLVADHDYSLGTLGRDRMNDDRSNAVSCDLVSL